MPKNFFTYQKSLDFLPKNLPDHLQIAERHNGNGEKNLLVTSSGKFYTPKIIGKPLIEDLASQVLTRKRKEISIIDPFAGDGRLILWFLEYFKNSGIKWTISLWDCDGKALEKASKRLALLIKKYEISSSLQCKKVDTFNEFLKDGYDRSFDIVITNPPWEIIKPNPSEISHMNGGVRKKYIRSLKRYSKTLATNYPLSKPKRMYGGWGVNLARVGTEVALRLAKKGGVVGVITPASLLADQNSSNLRSWLFEKNNCIKINYYPAETKLFDKVDQPFAYLVFTKKKSKSSFQITAFDKKLNKLSDEEVKIPKEFLKSNSYIIPISFGFKTQYLRLLSNLHKHPSLEEFATKENGGLWLGRELDETRHHEWLTTKGKHLFVKGGMIDRFDIKSRPQLYVNQEIKRDIPPSVKFKKIVWRDVSRPSQKRRMIVTLLPKNLITGNSLNVAYFKSDKDVHLLYILLAFMSSFVFEFQVRSLSATAHISAATIRKVRVPSIDPFIKKKIGLMARKRLSGKKESERELEIAVAKAYGLNRKQFSLIINAFPKLTKDEKSALLDKNLWYGE